MRRRTVGIFAVVGLAVSGCGSSGSFANRPRPASPVNLTVYINNDRVSVSPRSVGAGLVVFVVTNQANTAQSVSVRAADGSSQTLANTGPINPQSTQQVTVDFRRPGNYTVESSSGGGGSDASSATQTRIRPAAIHIGAKRPSSSNALLQP